MPTTKEPKTENARGVAERLAKDSDALAKAAETILWELDSDTPIDSGDFEVLRMAGFTDSQMLNIERGRIGSVKRHMSKAGSSREFGSSQKTHAAAVAKEKKERPAIEEQIRVLTSQLQELEANREKAAATLHGYENARENLRHDRMLPKFIRDRLAYEKTLAGLGIKKPIAELDSRIAVIEAVLKLQPNSQGALLHARSAMRSDPSLKSLIREGGNGSLTTEGIDAAEWTMYVQRLQLELPRCEEELSALREEWDSRLAEGQGPREHYIAQLPE